MDTGAERIAQDIQAIVQTRVAIAEKLGSIEQHIGNTMQHARATMTEVADKTTSSVCEAVQATQEALDPGRHVARHPWMAAGGAVAFGYAVGALYRRGWRISTGVIPYDPPGTKGAGVRPSGSPSSEQRTPGVYPFYADREAESGRAAHSHVDRPTVWAELEQVLHEELGVVRKGVIRFGRGLIREMIHRAVPAVVETVGGIGRDRKPRR